MLYEEDWTFDLPNGVRPALAYLTANSEDREGKSLDALKLLGKTDFALKISGSRVSLTRKIDNLEVAFFLLTFLGPGGYSFEGTVTEANGRATLSGRYRFPDVARSFLAFWFSAVALFAIVFSVATIYSLFDYIFLKGTLERLGISSMCMVGTLLLFGAGTLIPWLLMIMDRHRRVAIYRLLCTEGIIHPMQ